MKKLAKVFPVFLILLVLVTSCLKKDLPQAVNSNLNTMTSFNYLYKYVDTTIVAAGTPNEDMVITVQEAALTNIQRISNDTFYCSPSFPSSFPFKQKSKVTLTHIWAYADIPDGAIIAPLNGAPVLGTPGDYTKDVSYKVTAANGTAQTFVIVTASLPLVNKYEGMYTEVGYFNHPTSPRALSSNKYLSSVNANTVSCDLADLGSNGYTMTISVNPDNTCVVIQYASGVVISQSQMVPGAVNSWDPATKTFTLNYQYMGSGGWRTINETLTMQ